MKCYIVRVYREKQGKEQEFVGVVETVGVEGKSVFTTFEELCAILKPATEDRAEKAIPENDAIETADDIRF
jgi:hypothetical protein